MALFEIDAISRDDKSIHKMLFNNINNDLIVDGKAINSSVAIPCETDMIKKPEKITRLKLQLGLTCNFGCSYCCQEKSCDGEVPDINDYIKMFPESLAPEKVEFWGGETLLYWEDIPPLVKFFKEKNPLVRFYIPTNGLLISREIVDFCVENNVGISISHDGPGQSFRGKDVLTINRDNILYAYEKLAPQKSMSFNCTIHSENFSRAEIQRYFEDKVGTENLAIGEGLFMHVMTHKAKNLCLLPEEFHAYRRIFLNELIDGSCSRFMIVKSKILNFIDMIERKEATPTKTICGLESGKTLVVDRSGNIIVCQNSAEGTAKNNLNIHVSNFPETGILVDDFPSWVIREECKKCPVVSLCLGGCPNTPDDLRENLCDCYYSDCIPMWAFAIEELTGFLPYYIHADLPENRKSLFE